MQQTLISQIEELIDNLHRNKNDNMEFRIIFGDNFKSRLTVLFEDEFDKISNQLEEWTKQMEICQFPDSSYTICHHPDDENTKLYVFNFQVSQSLTEARYNRFVFLKGIRDSKAHLDDYPVLKQVKF